MVNRIFELLKNKNYIQLVSNFFYLMSIKGVDFLIPLFVLPFLVRTLGIDVFGLISFSLAFCMYFGTLIHYGYSITAVRDIARVSHNLEELSKKYSSFITVAVLLLFLSLIVFILIISFIPILKENWLLHVYTFFFISMQSLFPSWFFQGIEKMKYIAFINISTKILFLISLIFLIKGPDDYLLVPLLNAITMTLSTAISFWTIHKYFKIKYITPIFSEIKQVIIEGQYAFISMFAPTLYNNTAMFLLGYTSSNSTVGIYASATKLIDALNSTAVLLSTTFLPFLSKNIKKHIFFSKIMITIGASLSILAFIFSKELIIFLYGNENMEIFPYFRLLTPMVFFIFIRLTYGPNYLMLIGKELLYKNIVLYSCLLFFIIALIIVPVFKIYGAIGILNCTTFIMALLTYSFFIKTRNKK
jgi:PST family polysaccharide transporter